MATTVEVLVKTIGGPANGIGGGGAPNGPGKEKDAEAPQSKPGTKILTNIFGGVSKFVKGQLGLNFGLTSMLKQSQIFTSTVGVIFQLMGALVDVILAPFLPLIVPIIRQIGKAVPIVQDWMQRVISPKVDAIVSWITQFLGKWDGSWSMLMGSEGLGGLGDKFLQWWSGIGSGWISGQTVALMDGIVNKLGGLWDWFKETDTRLQGWIITLIITQFKNVGQLVLGMITGAGKFVLGLPMMLAKMSGGLIKMFPLGKLVVGIISGVFKIATGIVKVGSSLLSKLFTAIVSPIKIIWGLLKQFPQKIFSRVAELAKTILGSIGKKLGDLPLIGGMFKKLGSGGLMKTIGTMAKATKAIPILGAVATAGFGAAETWKAFQEHGVKAGLAYGTKTIAATALTGLGFSAAGLAVDVGGSMALGHAFKNGGGSTSGGDIYVTVNGPNKQEQVMIARKNKSMEDTILEVGLDEI